MRKRRKGGMLSTARLEMKSNGPIGKVARFISKNYPTTIVHVRRGKVIIVKEIVEDFGSPFIKHLMELRNGEE